MEPLGVAAQDLVLHVLGQAVEPLVGQLERKAWCTTVQVVTRPRPLTGS
jgi:hypothetical protein